MGPHSQRASPDRRRDPIASIPLSEPARSTESPTLCATGVSSAIEVVEGLTEN
jgi:hypothetical protein